MLFGILLSEKLFIKLINELDPEIKIINKLIKLFNITENYKECYLNDIDINQIPEDLYDEYYLLQEQFDEYEFNKNNIVFKIKKMDNQPNEPMFLYIEYVPEYLESIYKMVNYINEYFKIFELQDYIQVIDEI